MRKHLAPTARNQPLQGPTEVLEPLGLTKSCFFSIMPRAPVAGYEPDDRPAGTHLDSTASNASLWNPWDFLRHRTVYITEGKDGENSDMPEIRAHPMAATDIGHLGSHQMIQRNLVGIRISRGHAGGTDGALMLSELCMRAPLVCARWRTRR
jgi:hypothetical protein